MSEIYKGNALIDGHAGWFFGDREPPSPRYHKDVYVKYATHYSGDQCRHPYVPSRNMSLVLLINGGPFVHFFRDSEGIKLHDVALDQSGDYVIYGPEVSHSWTAMRESTVLTIQFPPSNADPVLP